MKTHIHNPFYTKPFCINRILYNLFLDDISYEEVTTYRMLLTCRDIKIYSERPWVHVRTYYGAQRTIGDQLFFGTDITQ